MKPITCISAPNYSYLHRFILRAHQPEAFTFKTLLDGCCKWECSFRVSILPEGETVFLGSGPSIGWWESYRFCGYWLHIGDIIVPWIWHSGISCFSSPYTDSWLSVRYISESDPFQTSESCNCHLSVFVVASSVSVSAHCWLKSFRWFSYYRTRPTRVSSMAGVSLLKILNGLFSLHKFCSSAGIIYRPKLVRTVADSKRSLHEQLSHSLTNPNRGNFLDVEGVSHSQVMKKHKE